jgi:hypothetical protein
VQQGSSVRTYRHLHVVSRAVGVGNEAGDRWPAWTSVLLVVGAGLAAWTAILLTGSLLAG